MGAFIAFDLDALNVVPAVASASGLPPGDVALGLLNLWAWCFREEVDQVSAVHVRGHFGGRDCTEALAAFGFLAPLEGGWRVRGAERYLRIKAAQREGGRRGRAKSTSKVGKRTKPSGTPRGGPEGRPQGTPQGGPQGTPQGGDQGLGQGLDKPLHRSPITDHLQEGGATVARPSDDLCADFARVVGSPYTWQGAADGVALAKLLKVHPLAEVRSRWVRGLSLPSSSWPAVRTVSQLAQRFNDLAPSKAAPESREHAPSRLL